MQKFENSKLIDLSWNALTRKIEDEKLRTVLKEIILRKWIGIRAKSFVKCWVNVAKRTCAQTGKKISEKAEPALRTTLFVCKKGSSSTK